MAYRVQDQCAYIEAKISEELSKVCPNDIYDQEDTRLGRIVLLCTCASTSRKKGSEEPCDLKLSREVPRLLMLSVNRLPACYYGHVEHYSLGEAPSGHAIYKSQRVIKQSRETLWCYVKLRVAENGTSYWDSGEANAAAEGIRSICAHFQSIKERYLCEIFNDQVICCCKNAYDVTEPCNGAGDLESFYMQSLVPFPRVWETQREHLHDAALTCPIANGATETCLKPVGCYFSRLTYRELLPELPHGCISNLTPERLDQYPFLMICERILTSHNIVKRCFATGTTYKGDWLVACCCETGACTSKFIGKRWGYRVKDEL
uniref:Uncharacterized protein n=2 Tax=Parascaris univalens TaxID=6257 RepID=A0A915A0D0_PARUN